MRRAHLIIRIKEYSLCVATKIDRSRCETKGIFLSGSLPKSVPECVAARGYAKMKCRFIFFQGSMSLIFYKKAFDPPL